jgi:hypothetical protein
MTDNEEIAMSWIRENPAYMLGYVESMEKELNKIYAATSLPHTPIRIFSKRSQFTGEI